MNFLAGEGWRSFEGYPLVGWPPLFPLLLAAFGWVGLDPLEAGRWINATAFGLTILAAGLYTASHLRSRLLTLAATVALLASLPLSEFAGCFLTDPLFALLTLLALIQLAAFLNRKTVAPLLLSTIFTALAAITRYPGVALIAAGVLMLLPLARPKHTLVFGAISSVPLLTVLAHNWTTSKTLTSPRSGSGQSLLDSLSQVMDVFRTWGLPNMPTELAHLLWLAITAVGLASAAVVLRVARIRSNVRLEPALPFAVFALTYLVFMIAVVPLTVGQPIDSRYLLPIYVPLLLVGVFLLDRLLSIESAGWMVTAKWCLISLVLLASLAHIGYSAHRNLTITDKARAAGFRAWSAGLDEAYNTADWQHSATLNYVKTNLSDGRTYSNNQYRVWFADRTAAIKKHRALPNKMRDWTQHARWWSENENEVHIVWFKDAYHGYYDYNDLDIRFLPGVEPVAELLDGVVFRVTATAATEPFDEDRLRAQKERYVNQLLQQASEHVARSGWDVYRNGRKLIYRKQPCAPADVQAKFVLHVIPANPADLPADRKQYDSDNLDFYFDWHGERFDNQCTVIAPLPAYAIDRIYIGQWISAENRTLWEAEFPFSASR